MFSSVTALCALLAITSSALAQTETLPPGMQAVIRDLDAAASDAVKNPNDIGYTLGVVTRNGLAWTKSYGFTDGGRTRPAGSDTPYAVGTGAFSAIMLLQLVRDGKAHLSDVAEKYVPDLKPVRSQYPDAAPVTLMQLALHTSGLDLEPKGANRNDPVAGWDNSVIAALPNARYAFEPGTHAAASQLEDALLALALSRAASQPYEQYVQEKILTPLGMSQSRFSSRVRGLNPVLRTTLGDLARFASFLMLGGPESVLSRNELEENYRRVWVGNSVAVPNPSEWFGIGYDGETWTSNHYYFIPSIGSTQPGFDATFWFEPRRHAGVILLHQGAGGGALGQMIHAYVYTLNAQRIDAGRQEPVKPFPYTEEEVSFENQAAEIKLAGSLTIPSGTGPFPAVVLIPKSGPLDRDERMLNHRPFLILADYLTRAGIAVLRTDVRGVGKSGGKFAGAQSADFAADAEAAMEYLRTRKEVNAGRVGLISHGEGGQAAGIAAARNHNVAFVVMLGAAAIPLAENSVEGSRLTAEASGELRAKAEAQASLTRGILTIILRDSNPATLEKNLREFLSGKLPESQIAPQMRQWTPAAFRAAMSYDPSPELKKINCPVLALYAEKDFTVPAKLNVPAMRAALAGNQVAEVEELSDLNLLFQTADVGLGREANWAEETMAPTVLNRIADWVIRQGSRL